MKIYHLAKVMKYYISFLSAGLFASIERMTRWMVHIVIYHWIFLSGKIYDAQAAFYQPIATTSSR